MSTLTVSVLIKAYNHAPYMRQTIESVLGQSFQDFEIVVTDDASTDGTADLLRGFTDPRIRLEILPRNLGISGAMNACLDRARGRYFAILNSDDWALPGRLERQVAFLDANPGVSLLFGLPRPVGEQNEPVAAFNDFRIPLGFPDFSQRSWLRQFFFHGNCLCAPTAMIRREAYDSVGRYDRRLTNLQDLDMWIRMAMAGYDIALLPEELTAFRIRAGNANMSAARPDSMLRTAFEMTRILRHFFDLAPPSFEAIFGEEARASSTRDAPVPYRVAELARANPRIEYQSFALDYFYEAARDDDAFDRLRERSGSMDIMGWRTATQLWEEIHRLQAQATEQQALVARQQIVLRSQTASLIDLQARVAAQDAAAQERESRARTQDARLRREQALARLYEGALLGREPIAGQVARIVQKIASSPFAASPYVPGHFSPLGYVALNPDLLAAEIDPFEHYLAFGRPEGRSW